MTEPARDAAGASGTSAPARPRGGQTKPASRRPLLRRLLSSVLVFEAIVLVLAMPVAITIEHVPHGVAGGVGGGLAFAAIVLAGLVGRARWALVAGTVLQVLIIAAGFEVAALYVLGVIFTALWFTGIWMAGKLEQVSPG
jgi:Protein of unknown function (DUF4233)